MTVINNKKLSHFTNCHGNRVNEPDVTYLLALIKNKNKKQKKNVCHT